MTEKKKRGLWSWLGLGSSTSETEQEQAQQTTLDEPDLTAEETSPALSSTTEPTAEASEQENTAEIAEPIEEKSQAIAHKLVEHEEDNKRNIELVINEEEPSAVELTNQERDEDRVSEPLAPEVVDAARAAEMTTEHNESAPTKVGFFARLKQGLGRTKTNIGSGFLAFFRGKKIDEDLFEELEEQLLLADVGMDTTLKIIQKLTEKASHRQLKEAEALYALLKEELAQLLAKVDEPLVVENTQKPYVILMVGVNGVGKTTTIGKLAKQFQQQGKKVLLAAGDTFRAAAVEQLQVWGERNQVPVIAQHTGADSASVIFDAIEAAKARHFDVVIADTAGRLQNKSHLMEELRKIVRVMKKIDPQAPHEIMLTLDAGTGQNAISQAKLFSEVAPVTGLTLTKLDGTAKGGVIFALADQFQIPLRYIGVGEGIEDLRPFNAEEFIEALFSQDE